MVVPAARLLSPPRSSGGGGAGGHTERVIVVLRSRVWTWRPDVSWVWKLRPLRPAAVIWCDPVCRRCDLDINYNHMQY